MSYVDGFVLAVKDIAAYKKMATMGGKIWMEHGALSYVEAAGDDLDVPYGTPFTKLVKPKPGETIIFAFITFRSRAHRDKVNAKVMADPRMKPPKKGTPMPFDMKRMAYGGFKSLVDK